MFAIDDRDWVAVYLWGEISWVDMELFEKDGKIWTNDSLDLKIESTLKECSPETSRKIRTFDPVLYASKMLCPKDETPTKDLNELLDRWTKILDSGAAFESPQRPEKSVEPRVSFRFVEEWLKDNPDAVDVFLGILKEIL